jgi:WD repeat-containing protein 6
LNHHLVLSGQGPFIQVENVSSREIIVQEQAFEFQSIHGIKVQDAADDQNNVGSFSLLIWGGRSIALARFGFSSIGPTEEYSTPSLQVGPENEAFDWILDASFAASAHASSNIAYAVTAHNAVFALRAGHSQASSVVFFHVANGPDSILYSAHIKPMSTTTLLVAAGTVFGEVILWSCYLDTSGVNGAEERWRNHVLNVFHGHTGSIFGVSLSDGVGMVERHRQRRLLASCSDDRTLRLWDVGDCDGAPKSELDMSGRLLRTTWQKACQSIDKASIATTWAHSSRIWGVKFMSSGDGSCANSWQLISRGEDATCQIWEATLEGPTRSTDETDRRRINMLFKHADTDHYHSGKHIWSFSQYLEKSGSTIVTGGSDGAIIARTVTAQNAKPCYLSIKTPFCDLLENLEGDFEHDGSMSVKSNDSIRQYVLVSGDAILATTNQGRVVKGTIDANIKYPDHSLSITWSLLIQAVELRGFAVMASDTAEGVVYIGSASGNLWMYHHGLRSIQLLTIINQKISNIFKGSSTTTDDETTGRYLLVASANSMTAKLLQITQSSHEPNCSRVSKSVDLSLPPTFQLTVFLEAPSGSHLILGSRSGALAIYQDVNSETDAIVPAICIRHIHGSDSVTCLQHLRAENDNKKDTLHYDLMSTGKDGSYAIHRVTFQNLESRGKHPTLITLHRSYPPFGPNIEGVYAIMKSPFAVDLILYGFDRTNFVVWNESLNSEVMSIPCGGAHRSWAYLANSVILFQSRSDRGGCFVWTKAGDFNLAKFDVPAHRVMQPGGHGREIKAMALHSGMFRYGDNDRSDTCLVATGAEDTAIRLWAVATSNRQTHARTQPDNISCIRILKKHTTGVQHLAFCKDFLFSSSGFEELFIWKINFDVSVVGVGAVFQAALPKCAAVSDLRITSFEVTCLDDNQVSDAALEIKHFLIYAAYSNSLIRVFKYTTDEVLLSEDRFQLLAEGCYNSTCLTNLHRLPGCCPCFLTSSTNGAVAAWPVAAQHVKARDPPAQLSYIAEHSIHQNAILALQSIQFTPEYHLLLTGGDDNAFGITLIVHSGSETSEPSEPDEALSSPRFGTLLIPRAHAAAITALEVLGASFEDSVAILTAATAGNDQLLKVWRITVALDELPALHQNPGMDPTIFGPKAVRTIDVQLLKAMWTSVADVSSMIVIPGADATANAELGENKEVKGSRRRRLMLAGIGMEMFSLDLDIDDGGTKVA